VIRERRVVDLSHVMIPGKEEYGLKLETHNTADLFPQYQVDNESWYILQTIHMGSHCGTHIEFPYHHNREGLHGGDFPLVVSDHQKPASDYHFDCTTPGAREYIRFSLQVPSVQGCRALEREACCPDGWPVPTANPWPVFR